MWPGRGAFATEKSDRKAAYALELHDLHRFWHERDTIR
jgi:hypothetical protein